MPPALVLYLVVVLFWAAGWLIIHMMRKFPADYAELRQKYHSYRTRNDPAVLGRIDDPENRKDYQASCVVEFRGVVVFGVLSWGIEILGVLCALGLAWVHIRRYVAG